jgi:hypothetical protein
MSEEIRGSRILRVIGKAGLIGLVLLSVIAPSPMAGVQDVAKPPTIVPDQTSYSPGETIVLIGSNWLPGEIVTISLCADSGHDGGTVEATADESGSFGHHMGAGRTRSGRAELRHQ